MPRKGRGRRAWVLGENGVASMRRGVGAALLVPLLALGLSATSCAERDPDVFIIKVAESGRRTP